MVSGLSEPGWVPEARPAPPELSEKFESPGFDPSIEHEHDHIDSWNSFGNILGPDGVKALMKAVR
jgi:hypothetical protein